MATDGIVAFYSTTLTATAPSLTISGIPGNGYRDLRLVIGGSSGGIVGLNIRVNGDSGNNYSNVYMSGYGSAIESTATSGSQDTHGVIGGNLSMTTVDWQDYSATDKHKTWLATSALSDWGIRHWAARWANTAAITSITLTPNSGSFAAGTSFSLFGIVG